MKKLLCFVLALAMIFGCLSMVTFVQAEGEEYAGLKVSNFTKSNGQDTLYFYDIYRDMVVEGDTVTLTIKVHYSNPDASNGVWYTLTPLADAVSGTVLPTTDFEGSTSSNKFVYPGEAFEFSFTFNRNWLNPSFGFQITLGMEKGTVGEGEFIFESNADVTLKGTKANGGFWCYDAVTACTVENLTAEQMPGYVPEYTGVRVTFDSMPGYTDGYTHLYVYNVAEKAVISGETATITARIYLEGPVRIWVYAMHIANYGDVSMVPTGATNPDETPQGQWAEYSAQVPASIINADTYFALKFTTWAFATGSSIVVDTAGSTALADANSKVGYVGCSGSAQYLTAEQMPGYVAPTEEPTPEITPEPTPVPAGVKVQLDTAKDGKGTNYLYFYNVANGVEINGDTASITFKAYNTAYDQTIWVGVDVWSENPWTIIGSETPAIQVDPATANEVTVTFPASYVNQYLMLRVRITSMTQISAGASFVFESNADIYMDANKSSNGLWLYECSGTGTNLSKEDMPVIATPTPTPTPTPAPVGVKLDINTAEDGEIFHINNSTTISDAMVTDGVVTYTTTIYNPNNHDITIQVQLLNSNGWAPLVSNPYIQVVVPANTKKTVTLTVNLADEGITKEEVHVRYSTIAGVQVNDVIYFSAENAGEGLYDIANWWGFNMDDTKTPVYELPALDEAVEATPTPTPTPTPVPVGVKVDINSEIGDGKSIYVQNVNGATFTDANVVDGFVTATTEIYNPNNHDVTFGVQLQKNWADFDPVVYAQVVIPANSKKTVTLTVDRNAVTYAEEICIRYSFVEGIVVGDSFYFTVTNAAEPFYNANNWWVQYTNDSSPASSVTELPALEEAIVNKIEGAQLQLGSSLSVIYYATVDNNFINSGNDIILAVTRNEKTVYITGTKVDTNMYSFTYTGINAQCMADTIDAVLICGEDMLDSYADYSVKQYAINQYTNGANLKLDKLLNDMLVYGAEAQKTSGYMIDELATDDVAWIQVSSYVAPNSFVANNEIVELNDAANKVTTVGLNISNVNRIYFKVALTEGAQIKVYRNGVEVDYTVDGATVYTDAIYATDFDAVYTIEIVYDGNVVSRVNYSVNNYIISMHGHNKVGAITTALNNYGQSAVAYRA